MLGSLPSPHRNRVSPPHCGTGTRTAPPKLTVAWTHAQATVGVGAAGTAGEAAAATATEMGAATAGGGTGTGTGGEAGLSGLRQALRPRVIGAHGLPHWQQVVWSGCPREPGSGTQAGLDPHEAGSC